MENRVTTAVWPLLDARTLFLERKDQPVGTWPVPVSSYRLVWSWEEEVAGAVQVQDLRTSPTQGGVTWMMV